MAASKMVVYSHIVFATLKPVQDVPEEALVARTRTIYQGSLIVGHDLMTITVGDGPVKIVDANGQPAAVVR